MVNGSFFVPGENISRVWGIKYRCVAEQLEIIRVITIFHVFVSKRQDGLGISLILV
ncbi:hypothetical protein NMY3_03641 [Candidatus Nitrosocosmicus oleophilus]|uniref:Uncharacterized protein n=1 Tax=Candidatus Nitrosocosmicus oleophilus TaxID=1353260 RepID=A0A654M4V6_9ARCH|nr:hypothetical protein NMY3_03641 [Candidatus Nitrosocosmicus oleophilus]